MEPVTETHLQRMAQAIAAEVDPVCIILFGSRARGDARLDSDVDLLVVEDEPFGPTRCRLDESERIHRAVTGMGIAKDILLFSADEIDYWRDSLNHVVGRALREGRVLYERP